MSDTITTVDQTVSRFAGNQAQCIPTLSQRSVRGRADRAGTEGPAGREPEQYTDPRQFPLRSGGSDQPEQKTESYRPGQPEFVTAGSRRNLDEACSLLSAERIEIPTDEAPPVAESSRAGRVTCEDREGSRKVGAPPTFRSWNRAAGELPTGFDECTRVEHQEHAFPGSSAGVLHDGLLRSAEGASAPSVRFADLTTEKARQQTLWREQVVLAVVELIESGLSQRQAILRTVARPEFCQASATRARTWLRNYAEQGLDGLVDQKRGRVGRKAIAASVPGHVLDAAAAAAVEHGTLGREGQMNMARAYRNTILSHPDLPDEARAQIHGGHASKSYVPPSVRERMRVSPIAREMLRGPKATRLAKPFQPCTYDDVPPGRMITADDMTSNCYVWMEAPTPSGFIIGRPQVLAFADVGSLRWQLARVILRKSGAYTRDDVWGAVGDVMDTFGVYPEWLFEGGNLWRSKRVLGEHIGEERRGGFYPREQDRFGGLTSLGCRLHHSQRPQSKVVEQMFDQLQAEEARFPGYAGRNEREECPEDLALFLAACKRGQAHPRGQLLHVSDYRQLLEQVMANINAERNDGKILRGQSPDEAWETADPQLAALPENSKWLFRSNVTQVTIRRDGRLHVSLRSGKFREDYWYENPDLLQARAGMRVLVYWNDRNPEADAVVMSSGPRPAFMGVARYVQPVGRWSDDEEDMHQVKAREKAALAAARTEIVRLKPHLQRRQFPRPASFKTRSPRAHKDQDSSSNYGNQIGRSGDQFEAPAKAFTRAERQADERSQRDYVLRSEVKRVKPTVDDLDAALRCSDEEFDRARGAVTPEEFSAALGGDE